MTKNTNLLALEKFLRETVKANYYLTLEDLDPEALVNQLVDQLDKKQFVWLDNTIYVPNLLMVYAPKSPDKMEEIEVLFNSVVFMKHLYEYMTENGFKLLDFVRVEVEPSNVRRVAVEFHWQTVDEMQEGFTVRFDHNSSQPEIVAPRAEIPQLARLSILNDAECYRNNYVIIKRTTYLGRLRNIVDKETGQMLRRNDFVFARHHDPSSINNSVSRLHAKIVYSGSNFTLYDTGSANGTAVIRNGERRELMRAEMEGISLENGDIIQLGSAQLSFNLISEDEGSRLASLPSRRIDEEEFFRGDDSTFKNLKLSDIEREIEKQKH